MALWLRAAIAATTVTAGVVATGVAPSPATPASGPQAPVPVSADRTTVVRDAPVTTAHPAQRVAAGHVLVAAPVVKAAPATRTARTARKPAEPDPAEEFSFTLASFNVLGSQHTARGGVKPGYATGVWRARWSLALMDDRGYDVAGVQEAQPDQMAVLLSSGAWKSYPDAATSPQPATAQSVVWRDDTWTLVAGRSFPIPFLDRSRPQPMVLLRHRATGREMWFVNVHLAPRRDDRDGEGERDVATRALAGQVRLLRETGLPIAVTGDMNEHGEIFCDLTAATSLVAASGGSSSGRCLPPRTMRVDWIFGTADLQWSSFRFAQDPQVRRITDHTIPVVEVTVPGS